MKIAGIVAEYNPFHNGHFYQISQTKKDTGCDAVIAIMSGNFSQRGTATIADKYTRTKMALLGGADLVIELPVPFATSSAEYFARGAVTLLHQTGSVDIISFGSECGDISLLKQISDALIHDKAHLDPLIRDGLKQGLSFPRARTAALTKHLLSGISSPQDFALQEILESPNNILGIEYIKALTFLNSTITPYTVKRMGSNYHDTDICGPIASATAIRESMNTNVSTHEACMPKTSFELLNKHKLPSMEKLASFLHFKLMFSKEEDLYSLWDIPGDLIRTLVNLAKSAPTYSEFVNLASSKTYTRSTVQRALLRILLEIQKQDMNQILNTGQLPYLRILGCRRDSSWLLSHISKHADVPLVTNLGKQQHLLDAQGRHLMGYELKAAKLYHYLAGSLDQSLQDFTHPFLLI